MKLQDKWETLSSGVRRNGDILAKHYPNGWNFYRLTKTGSGGSGYASTESYGDTIQGLEKPVPSFEEGVRILSSL